jgi:hypothetical protein
MMASMGAPLVKPEYPPLLASGFYVRSVAEVRALCVKSIAGSIRRRAIMDSLEDVIRKLSTARIIGELWLNGSFLTEKIDPDDVDMLVHVSSDLYDADAKARALIDWAQTPI